MSQTQAMLYQNRQYTRVMNLKYKAKLKKLKKQIKNLVFENAALCDEVVQVQCELFEAREDRRFLARRVLRHEGIESVDQIKEEEVPRAEAKTQTKTTNGPKKRGPKKRQQAANNTEKTAPSARTNKLAVDSNGKPTFPMNLYNIMVHSPGEIIPVNPNFHTDHWIYPVGYVATRLYAHPKDPLRKCVYTCKILNNAGMPQFQIIPDNDLDLVFFGESSNVCHKALLEALQRTLSDVVKFPLNVQGEKFFGLANPTVKSLMQMDPGYTLCANFKGFAALEGSLPEESDPTMSYEALQSLITMSAYHHAMPEVKEEPPDELLDLN